jgi:hypothetical protein
MVVRTDKKYLQASVYKFLFHVRRCLLVGLHPIGDIISLQAAYVLT